MKSPAELKELFENHIRTVFQDDFWKGSLYQPIQYIVELPGKRYRPILLLLTYQAVTGESPERALNAALAVEFFHNFSLVHDDIMDNDPIRRGKPSVHEVYGVNKAILSGDAMFALTFEMLIKDFPEQAVSLIREYTQISVGVCEGQMEDMELPDEAVEDVPISRTLEMLRKKTAVLLGGAMSVGAICGGASKEVVDNFREFGEAVGIGFQLQDDYLDVYGEQKKLGKRAGSDIVENKKTVLLLKAFEKANADQLQRLSALLEEEDDAAKIAGVKAIFAELGIPEATKQLIGTYFDKAQSLSQQLSHLPGYVPIGKFLEAMMQREY